MPTYEFRCKNGHEFTRFYKTISGAATELPCPECDAVAERQLSGGAGLVFKGSGFYLTDYGKNAHRKPEVGSGKSDVAASKPESKPSEAKPEPKTESAKPKAEGPKPKAAKQE